jgi:surface antigen
MTSGGRLAAIAGLCASVVLVPVITCLVLGVTAESRVVRALEHRVARVMQRICERAQPAERLRWCAPSTAPRDQLRAWADDELDVARTRLRDAGAPVGAAWAEEASALEERQVTGAQPAADARLPDDELELVEQGGGSPSAESALEWDPPHAVTAPDDAVFLDVVAHEGRRDVPAGVAEGRVLVQEADRAGSVMSRLWAGGRVALRWAGVTGRAAMRLGAVASVVATLHDLLRFAVDLTDHQPDAPSWAEGPHSAHTVDIRNVRYRPCAARDLMEVRAYGDPGSHANHEALEAYRHSSFPENEGAPEPAYLNQRTNLFDQPTLYGQVAQDGCARDDVVTVPDTVRAVAPELAAQLQGRRVDLPDGWQTTIVGALARDQRLAAGYDRWTLDDVLGLGMGTAKWTGSYHDVLDPLSWDLRFLCLTPDADDPASCGPLGSSSAAASGPPCGLNPDPTLRCTRRPPASGDAPHDPVRGPGGAYTQLVDELRAGQVTHFATLQALTTSLAGQGGDSHDRLHGSGAAAVLRAELDHARSDTALGAAPSLSAGDPGAPRLATEDEQTAMLLALADVLGDYDSTSVAPPHGIAGGNAGIVQLLPSVLATQLHAAYVAGDATAATLVADDRQQFEAAAQELATSLTATHGDVVASYAAYVRTSKLPPFVATWPDEERSSEWLQLWGSETGDIYGHRGSVPTATLLAYAAAQYAQYLTTPALPLDQGGSAPPPAVPAAYAGTLPAGLGDFRAHAVGGGPLGPLPRLFADVPPGGFQPNRGWPVTECVWWASYNYPTAGVAPAPGHGWDAAEWWATFAGVRPEGQVPQVGAVAVWGPNPASKAGHVAVVIAVVPDATTFVVSEMNVVQPGSGIVDDRLVRTGSPFLRGFVDRPAPTAIASTRTSHA